MRTIERETTANTEAELALRINAQADTSTKLRQKLAAIDHRLRGIGSSISSNGYPGKRAWESADWLTEGAARHNWLPDHIGPQQNPRFDPGEIDRVRAARSRLGHDINLVGAKLPDIAQLPNSTTIAGVHSDLLMLERVSAELHAGTVPSLNLQLADAVERAHTCRRALEALLTGLQTLESAPWLSEYYRWSLDTQNGNQLASHLNVVFDQLAVLGKKRLTILTHSVSLPPEIFELGAVGQIRETLNRIGTWQKRCSFLCGQEASKPSAGHSCGGAPFDITSKSQAEKVNETIEWRKEVRQFVEVWNTLSDEIGLPHLGSNEGVGKWLSDTMLSIEKIRGTVIHSVPLIRTELPRLFPAQFDTEEILNEKEKAAAALDAVNANLAVSRQESR